MTRALRFILHNWPLKLAAVALATPALRRARPVPDDAAVHRPRPDPDPEPAGRRDRALEPRLRDADQLRRPARPRPAHRQIDLRGHGRPQRGPADRAGRLGRRDVEAVDDRIQVLDFEPQEISLTRRPPGQQGGSDRGGPAAPAVRARRRRSDPRGRDRRRQRAAVGRGDGRRRSRPRSSIDATGIDVNELVPLIPVDVNGDRLGRSGANRGRAGARPRARARSSPIAAPRPCRSRRSSVGTPAAGFVVASVDGRRHRSSTSRATRTTSPAWSALDTAPIVVVRGVLRAQCRTSGSSLPGWRPGASARAPSR